MSQKHFSVLPLSIVIVQISFCVGLTAKAESREDKDVADIEAIQKVQNELRNSSTRSQMENQNQATKEVAGQVKTLSGNSKASEDEIYALAADVLGNFEGKSVQEIQQTLLKASANPDSFAKSWSPEQQAKLKALAERLPAANSKSNKPAP